MYQKKKNGVTDCLSGGCSAAVNTCHKFFCMSLMLSKIDWQSETKNK